MRGRRHKLQVSTFPFLAVLLCAMGSLILVLLVMDRKAHQAAQARAQREAARLVEEAAQSETARQAERERLQQEARKSWEQKRDALHEKLTREQVEMQLQMRKVREQLQQIAARLHYEQDTTTQLRRKVQDEQSRLQAEEQLLRTLHTSAKQTEEQSKESSQTLRRMTLDVLQMEQVLKDLKASRQREQKTFSVVPYHGRRGENRRPIYVECTAEGVIFHPERKAMSISSGDVRAEVERRVAGQRQKLAGLPGKANQTPYLLLLLRPGGVTTYHFFQAALKGQDLDFGYEFIDDDWVLDFPADDELPSTQPWMIAAKPSDRPNLPSVTTASPPQRAPNRPMGMPPTGAGGGLPISGARVFRGGGAGATGSWGTGTPNANGSPRNGTGGSPGGTGATLAGGIGMGHGSPGSGNGSEPRPLESGLAGPLPYGRGSDSMTPTGIASGQSGALPYGRGSDYPSRGTGHGHPSAMPPSFPSDEDGTGSPADRDASGGGFRGVGRIALRGSNPGNGSGYGLSSNDSPGGPNSDGPGLGPPQALSSTTGEYSGGSSTGQSAIAGTSPVGNGIPGGGMAGNGSTGPGNSGSAPVSGTFGQGRSLIARGNDGGSGDASGAVNTSGSVPGAGCMATPGALGSSGNPSGTQNNPGFHSSKQGPGGSYAGTQGNGGGSSGTQGAGGSSVGAATNNMGGSSGGQAPGGGPMPANGSRSSDVVIFVDPLTGKPTTPPRPTTQPASGAAEERLPEDGNRRTPRVRVVVGNNVAGGGSDESPDNASAALNRFAPTPSPAPPPRRAATALRPVWVHGGRDWTIYVECRAADLVLYPSQRTFTLPQVTSAPAGNPLLQAIQQMIERRQSSRRPGEPPYHPQLCLLVRPEHIRTLLTVYPALEALPVPKTRRNLDADDDVIGIVTGAVP